MSFPLQKKESLAYGLSRSLLEQTDSAIQELSLPPSSETIHEARKHLKRARAILYLIKPALDTNFRHYNQALAECGRMLSPWRDFDALEECFKRLELKAHIDTKSYRFSAVLKKKHFLEKLQFAIQELQQKEQGSLFKSPLIIQDVLKKLKEMQTLFSLIDYRKISSKHIKKRVKHLIQSQKKSKQKALSEPLPSNLHEWRKQTKKLWYVIVFLEKHWREVEKDLIDQLDQLGEALGQQHDDAILLTKVCKLSLQKQKQLDKETIIFFLIYHSAQQEHFFRIQKIGESAHHQLTNLKFRSLSQIKAQSSHL